MYLSNDTLIGKISICWAEAVPWTEADAESVVVVEGVSGTLAGSCARDDNCGAGTWSMAGTGGGENFFDPKSHQEWFLGGFREF